MGTLSVVFAAALCSTPLGGPQEAVALAVSGSELAVVSARGSASIFELGTLKLRRHLASPAPVLKVFPIPGGWAGIIDGPGGNNLVRWLGERTEPEAVEPLGGSIYDTSAAGPVLVDSPRYGEHRTLRDFRGGKTPAAQALSALCAGRAQAVSSGAVARCESGGVEAWLEGKRLVIEGAPAPRLLISSGRGPWLAALDEEGVVFRAKLEHPVRFTRTPVRLTLPPAGDLVQPVGALSDDGEELVLSEPTRLVRAHLGSGVLTEVEGARFARAFTFAGSTLVVANRGLTAWERSGVRRAAAAVQPLSFLSAQEDGGLSFGTGDAQELVELEGAGTKTRSFDEAGYDEYNLDARALRALSTSERVKALYRSRNSRGTGDSSFAPGDAPIVLDLPRPAEFKDLFLTPGWTFDGKVLAIARTTAMGAGLGLFLFKRGGAPAKYVDRSSALSTVTFDAPRSRTAIASSACCFVPAGNEKPRVTVLGPGAKVEFQAPLPELARAMGFDPTGRRLVVATESQLLAFEGKEPIATQKLRVRQLKWNPRGEALLVADEHRVSLVAWPSLEARWTVERTGVRVAQLDERAAVLTRADGTLEFLAPGTGASRGQLLVASTATEERWSSPEWAALAEDGTFETSASGARLMSDERPESRRRNVLRYLLTGQDQRRAANGPVSYIAGCPSGVAGLHELLVTGSPDGAPLTSLKVLVDEAERFRALFEAGPAQPIVHPVPLWLSAGRHAISVELKDAGGARSASRVCEVTIAPGPAERTVQQVPLQSSPSVLTSGPWAAVDDLSRITVLEAASGLQRLTFATDQGGVRALRFSPDGTRIAARLQGYLQKSSRLIVWSLTPLQLERVVEGNLEDEPETAWFDTNRAPAPRAGKLESGVLSLPAPDGGLEAVARLSTGAEIVRGAGFSADGRSVWLWGQQLWNLDLGTGELRELTALPAEPFIANLARREHGWLVSRQGEVTLDGRTWRLPIAKTGFPLPPSLSSVAVRGQGVVGLEHAGSGSAKAVRVLAPDGGTALISAPAQVELTDLSAGTTAWVSASVRAPSEGPELAAQWLPSAHCATENDDVPRTGKLFELVGSKLVLRLEHPRSLRALALDGAGTPLVGDGAGLVARYQGGALEPIVDLAEPLCDLEVSPDGKRLAVSTLAGQVAIVELASGRVEARRVHSGAALGLAWSPDNRFLLSRGDDGLRFLAPGQGEVASFTLGAGGAFFITLPTGEYLASRNPSSLVAFAAPDAMLSWDALDDQRNRPDRVLAAFGLASKELIASLANAAGGRAKQGARGARPSVRIARATVSGPRAVLELEAKPPPARVELRVRDVRVVEQAWPAGQTSVKLEVPLAAGPNVVRAQVTAADGAPSYGAIVRLERTTPRTASTLWIASAGVSAYDQKDFSLRFAAADAQAIAGALASPRSSSSQVEKLVLPDLRLADLPKLEAFLRRARPDDTVVLFLAGHGLLHENGYRFAPADTDFAKPGATTISFDTLDALLEKSPALERVMLLDTCHAGPLDEGATQAAAPQVSVSSARGLQAPAWGRSQRASFDALRGLFTDLGRGSGSAVLAAGSGREVALEREGHGLFTAAVLDAIAGEGSDVNGDGSVSVGELLLVVADRVERDSGGVQRPTLRRDVSAEDPVLLRHPALKAEARLAAGEVELIAREPGVLIFKEGAAFVKRDALTLAALSSSPGAEQYPSMPGASLLCGFEVIAGPEGLVSRRGDVRSPTNATPQLYLFDLKPHPEGGCVGSAAREVPVGAPLLVRIPPPPAAPRILGQLPKAATIATLEAQPSDGLRVSWWGPGRSLYIREYARGVAQRDEVLRDSAGVSASGLAMYGYPRDAGEGPLPLTVQARKGKRTVVTLPAGVERIEIDDRAARVVTSFKAGGLGVFGLDGKRTATLPISGLTAMWLDGDGCAIITASRDDRLQRWALPCSAP